MDSVALRAAPSYAGRDWHTTLHNGLQLLSSGIPLDSKQILAVAGMRYIVLNLEILRCS